MKVGNLFWVKAKDIFEMVPEKSKNMQSIPKIGCELCSGNHKVDQCPHERRFSLEINTTSSESER